MDISATAQNRFGLARRGQVPLAGVPAFDVDGDAPAITPQFVRDANEDQ